MTQAHDYARAIADEIEALDSIAEQLGEDGPEHWDAETRAYVADIGLDEDDAPEHDVGMTYLETNSLDVYAVTHWRHDRTDVEAVTILRTCNGPHCEITYRGHGDRLEVSVWSGSDTATVHTNSTTLCQALEIVWDNAEQAVAR